MTTTNDIKYYDVDTIFKLNHNMKISVKYIDSFPILIIKDIYLNPDLVRDLCINTPVPYTNTNEKSGYPGRRGRLLEFMDCDEFFNKLGKILSFRLGIDGIIPPTGVLSSDRTFLFNVFDSDENTSNYKRYTCPHTDPALIASVIYLNKDDEEPVGTGIYRNKHSMSVFRPSCPAHNKLLENKFGDCKNDYYIPYSDCQGNHVLESNDDWELLYSTDGLYNTMIAYIGGMYHSALIDYKTFKNKNYKRINQVIFWNIYKTKVM